LYKIFELGFSCNETDDQCGYAMLAHKEAFGESKVYECARANYYQEEKEEDADDEIELKSDICVE